MFALLSGLCIGADHKGSGGREVGVGLVKEGKKCVLK